MVSHVRAHSQLEHAAKSSSQTRDAKGMRRKTIHAAALFVFVLFSVFEGSFSASEVGPHLAHAAPSPDELRPSPSQAVTDKTVSYVKTVPQLHEALRNLTTYIVLEASIQAWGKLQIPEQTHAITVRNRYETCNMWFAYIRVRFDEGADDSIPSSHV